ncbi:ras suppressor protein 1-like [Dreissena polymorpha]|uniref:ras suppressor protein 1-like n=1 Tax=Dreissena polymorpha TaxID=45954 RepID=UPI002263E8DD|nr:ras suppressor protein 1-like [Dreissena polymorpha]
MTDFSESLKYLRGEDFEKLVVRENDLVSLPREVGDLIRLRELHIQGNRLTVLPPEIGNLDLVGSRQVFRGENNPWVTPIADQYQVGVFHVFDYIRSETYKSLYGRHMTMNTPSPPKTIDKTKKISRLGLKNSKQKSRYRIARTEVLTNELKRLVV